MWKMQHDLENKATSRGLSKKSSNKPQTNKDNVIKKRLMDLGYGFIRKKRQT